MTELSDPKRLLLERRLAGAAKQTASPQNRAKVIAPRPAGASPPLSYAQERLWFMEQFAPGTAAYGVPLLVRLGADVDLALLESALRAVTTRHESLRMRFPATDDGKPTVLVDPPGPVPLPVIDVLDDQGALAAIKSAALRPFDLATGPLLRAALVRVAGGADHMLLLDMHHIVTDGWSNDIILREFGSSLAAGDGQIASAEPRVTQYGDFAGWQRDQFAAPTAAAAAEYWVDRLADVPALDLPTDRPRPATQTFAGASHWFRLSSALVNDLTTLGRGHRATLFMTLLAGYQLTLSRYSGQRCFAVGSPVAGRSLPELDGAVGMFVNVLPLRADVTGDELVGGLIDRVRDGVLDALTHQEVPFEKVVNDLAVPRDVSRPALFQAMFVLQNYEIAGGAKAVTAELDWSPVELPATRFDLELHAYPVRDGGLQCRFIYNTALFEPATAERLAAMLHTLLADLVAKPLGRVSDLAVVDRREAEVLASWNATATPPASAEDGVTLREQFERQTARTPEAVAVVDEHGALSYGELDELANRIAGRLRAEWVRGVRGVVGTPIVAVLAERSTDLVAGLLGVIKAGAAYLPLDPEYPAERLAYMLEDSGAGVVLAQRHLGDLLPESVPPVLLLDEASGWPLQPPPGERQGGPADGAAYLIYTSGSTGRPKGVINTHRGLANRLGWMRSALSVGPDDVVLQKTPASFDVSVWEFFLPLVTGARLALARPGGHRDPGYLIDAIESFGVTIIHFVPSMLNSFLADAAAGCATVRHIVCSGEELPAELARRCLVALPGASLHNYYGPTEASIDVTAWQATPSALAGRSRVPIGGPVSNVRMYVLDEQRTQVPVGVVGELYIGGVQVARGYHRRPALTAQRFLPDPFGPAGCRMYATGDHGRWRPDGSIEFLGRIDGQVKLRGMRIELGEIEVALRSQPGVSQAAVAVKETSPGDKRLVGYIVGTSEPDVAALRTALKLRLPDYMVPATFVSLDSLPLSPSGKLDRAALPAPGPAKARAGARTPPRTETERAIAAIWQDVLDVPEVGVDDDFFALGGHSLLATVVVAKLRKVTEGTKRRVGVMDLFKHPTVAELAALVEDQSAAGRARTVLYELTKPVPQDQRVCSYVCVPYGGGSAIVYQPIADSLPAGHCLYSVAIPGHDVGLDEDAVPFGELAKLCADEVLRTVEGPLVLYGHCGVGGALTTELARQLEAAGRPIDAIYLGGVFPFATPRDAMTRLRARFADLTSNRSQANWLKSMGVGMDEIDPAQADRIIANMRHDGKNAEEYFTELYATTPARLRAPVISVVGERDPMTDYYEERYKEWLHVAEVAALVVLPEAGHFFLRYRADEMVQIITSTHLDLRAARPCEARPREREDREREDTAASTDHAPPAGTPSMRRFALISVGQLVSITGSQLTGWAIPVWLYLTTHSLVWFGLSGASVVVPILIFTPLAGAASDRFDRRRVIMWGAAAAVTVELAFAVALWTGHTLLGLVYLLLWLLAGAGTFQRIAFIAAVPQLAPKRYLGHANGVVQMINGTALLFVPLLAAGLLAAIGLKGILLIDIGSYAFAIGVLAVTKFPDLMGRRRKETFRELLLGGARLSMRTPAFRAMLTFFAIGNLFYSVPVLLVTPLVLAFGSLGQVGQAAFAEGLGTVAGGAAMALWGGPRSRKMIVNIVAIAISGLFVMLTGARASLPIVLAGVFGTAVMLTLANGIYLTIIEVKVPQRFHGRIIALNQTITWAMLPIGFAVLLPLTGKLNPLLERGGALADTVGKVIGTGHGRGLGLGLILFGLLMTVNALVALGIKRLAKLDTLVPDALPDDLVGAQVLGMTERGDLAETKRAHAEAIHAGP